MAPTHPADAFHFARDEQGRSKGLMRIVRRFFMAETIACVTVHFDYLGKTFSETLRVVDVVLLKAWNAPVVTETVEEPTPCDDEATADKPSAWKPANNGTGARIWFVYRDRAINERGRRGSIEVAEGFAGNVRRFATREAAVKAATTLNKRA